MLDDVYMNYDYATPWRLEARAIGRHELLYTLSSWVSFYHFYHCNGSIV